MNIKSLKVYSVAELFEESEKKGCFVCDSEESGYRRGYSQGYYQAISDMYDFYKGGFIRTSEIFNIMEKFHYRLINWRGGKKNKFEIPPKLEIKKWVDIRKEVLNRDRNRCVLCRSEKSLHIHHIKNVKDGGLPEMENLETLCKECHKEEHRG